MKRIGNIFDTAVSRENLVKAHYDVKAKKRKKNQRRIERFEADFDKNIDELHRLLVNGEWRMHPYINIKRYESGKLRDIDYSPDWGDQIVQRAIGNTLGDLLNKSLINDTYAGIKGRGIQRAMRRMRRRVYAIPKDMPLYAYKIDMRKYYPSIDHAILKEKLLRKIKDKRMIDLLFVIIDSYPGGVGLPIGNLMSPVFANFYLSFIDHLAKSWGLMYYRYNDDIAVLSTSKQELREFKDEMHRQAEKIKLTIKPNEQVFPIERFGVDIMGYVMKRDAVLVRRRIERSFRRNGRIFREDETNEHRARSISSQWGWLKVTKSGQSLWMKVVGESVKSLNKRKPWSKDKNG